MKKVKLGLFLLLIIISVVLLLLSKKYIITRYSIHIFEKITQDGIIESSEREKAENRFINQFENYSAYSKHMLDTMGGRCIMQMSAFYQLCPTYYLAEYPDLMNVNHDYLFRYYLFGLMAKNDLPLFFQDTYFYNLMDDLNKIGDDVAECDIVVVKAILYLNFHQVEFRDDLLNVRNIILSENGGNHPYRHVKYPVDRALYEMGDISLEMLKQEPIGYYTEKYIKFLEGKVEKKIKEPLLRLLRRKLSHK